MLSIDNNSNATYIRRSPLEAELGYCLATAATALAYKTLPSFSNPFKKQMTREWGNNHLYKDVFLKSVENSGLTQKGLQIISETGASDIGRGLNACYIPSQKVIRLNINKASISGFHELGHAINHIKGGFSRFLQNLRGPGMALAGVMGTVALFSRNKPEDAKKNFGDFIQDNCGKIAFAAMLPTVAEETLASYRGVKLAKEAGLAKPLVNNLKKFYGKALLSYGGYALVTGVSVYLASKITEMFTRPQKINKPEY
ncbi:MAG: hypothetical protein E7Z92_07785 [Cyanobacteria bacterium SIG31]|nr:hypothetical protein [Cyanobacteria bacterium SIG31]